MKTCRKLLILLCLALSSQFSWGQNIQLIRKDYVYSDSRTGVSREWSHLFHIEGENKLRKAGYFGQHLKKYIQSDSLAVHYMNVYATRQSLKLTTMVSGFTLFSIFAISNLVDNKIPSGIEKENFSKNKGFLYASGGVMAANLFLVLIKPKSIQKAVDAFNQNLEKKELELTGFKIQTGNIPDKKSLCVSLNFIF